MVTKETRAAKNREKGNGFERKEKKEELMRYQTTAFIGNGCNHENLMDSNKNFIQTQACSHDLLSFFVM